jgi:hypothetical protein
METLNKPLFDPERARRGRMIATVCVFVTIAATLINTVPSIISGMGSLQWHLARIGLVTLCGIGAIWGSAIAVFLLSAYTSMAGTYLCIRGFYDLEKVSIYSLSLGAIYFISAIVLSLSPSVAENNKQRRFRDVEL